MVPFFLEKYWPEAPGNIASLPGLIRISLTYFVEENSPWSYGYVMQKGEIKVFAADKVPFT